MTPSSFSDGPIAVDILDQVARLTIMRADYNNSISNGVRQGLLDAFEWIASLSDIRVLIIEGEGEDTFSIGADVEEYSTMSAEDLRQAALLTKQVHEQLARLPMVTVAAIKGACTGAGFELALHCDIRFARDDARFGFPGITMGLTSGGNALWRLSQLIGAGPARALALTGGVISAERAFMVGVITNILKDEDYDNHIDGLINHLIELSPHAVARTKAMMNRALSGSQSDVAALGVDALAACFDEGEASQSVADMFGGAGPDTTVH